MPELHPFPDQFSPIGSGIFYAIRFTSSDRRAALSLVNAFYRTVKNIPNTCSDPSVASAKLEWWREEIQRGRKAQAEHPIARSLGELQQRYALQADYFDPLLQAVAQEITLSVIEKESDLERHCRHTGGLLADLYAIIGSAGETQRQVARELGGFLRMVEIIRNLGLDLRDNRCFIPADRLQEYRISPERLLNGTDEQNLWKLLSSITDSQQQRYREALERITDPSGLGPILAMAAMAHKLLETIHGDNYHGLLQQRTSLTPLHKLWISWRCQRKVR